MTDLSLEHFSDDPIYNTKAVVQQTGIGAATLRAWERRYGVPTPHRTNGNYRLYSERDIALIQWLRDRVGEGMTISRAVGLFRSQEESATPPLPQVDHVAVGRQLLSALRTFDEPLADRILNELFAVRDIEEVLTEVIAPVLVEIGELWHDGRITVATEHFTSAFIKRKLLALVNAQPEAPGSGMVVAGCAPTEQHEIGILILALFLRRRGLSVIYLGQNVPASDLIATVTTLQPEVVALSAMGDPAARLLGELSQELRQSESPTTLVYGGAIFDQYPERRDEVEGHYLGRDLREAVGRIVRLAT